MNLPLRSVTWFAGSAEHIARFPAVARRLFQADAQSATHILAAPSEACLHDEDGLPPRSSTSGIVVAQSTVKLTVHDNGHLVLGRIAMPYALLVNARRRVVEDEGLPTDIATASVTLGRLLCGIPAEVAAAKKSRAAGGVA